MMEEYVVSSVLSRHSKDLKWRASVRTQLQLSFIWQAKDSTLLRNEDRLHMKREVAHLGSSFYTSCLLPLSLPYVKWARQEGSLFLLRFSFPSWIFFCSTVMGFSLSLSFSHCHFGLLFPVLTIK